MTATQPGSGFRTSTKATSAQKRAPWILLAPFLASLFVLTFIIPIISALFQSFTTVDREGLFGEDGVTGRFAGFDNYVTALNDAGFVGSIWRMLLFGIVQVPVMIVLCTILALLLESASARWPAFFRAVYFMPYGVPGVIATILWSFLYVPGLSPIVSLLQSMGLQPDFLGANSVLWSIANIVTWTYTATTCSSSWRSSSRSPARSTRPRRWTARTPSRWRGGSRSRSSRRPWCSRRSSRSSARCSSSPSRRSCRRSRRPSTPSTRRTTPRTRTRFAFNEYGVASAQAVIIALAAFILSFAFLALTNRAPEERARPEEAGQARRAWSTACAPRRAARPPPVATRHRRRDRSTTTGAAPRLQADSKGAEA